MGILLEEKVDYGSLPTPPSDPFIDGYTFIGWNPASDEIKTKIRKPPIVLNITIVSLLFVSSKKGIE